MTETKRKKTEKICASQFGFFRVGKCFSDMLGATVSVFAVGPTDVVCRDRDGDVCKA